MTDTQTEIDVTARTVYGEARGEGNQGMKAVANVIRNRVEAALKHVQATGKPHPLFGDGTYEDCCKRPWQFSCWNPNDPNRSIISDVTTADPIFLLASQIASFAVNGVLPDITGGATYYKRIGTPASWAEDIDPCVTIGHQEFYNNVT